MRHKKAPKRKIFPDSKFNQEKIAKFINYVMRKGKKSIAQKIVYGALEIIAQKKKKDPLEIFNLALLNTSPNIEVKARRIGGANYQIPVEVDELRKFTLASRWIIEAARQRRGKAMKEKLAEEILAAAENQGAAVKKKEDVYRLAEANRAFTYFAKFIK